MSFSPFLKGLISSTVGGAVVALSEAKQQHAAGVSDLNHMGSLALTGAVLGLATYMVGHSHGEGVGQHEATATEAVPEKENVKAAVGVAATVASTTGETKGESS